VVNLYSDQFGNPKLPQRFETVQKRLTRLRWAGTAAALLVLAVVIAAIAIFSRYRERSALPAMEKSIAVLPFENLSHDPYNAYFRGLAYTLKTIPSTANALGAQKYLREAVRLDPNFALAWALFSFVNSRAYGTQSLQPTVALREEARQAAETALTLQPNLGEAVLAKGSYYYYCLKDYDTAVRYFEQARQVLPNSNRIPESLAYVARRRGQWDRSESYFNEAEK